MGIHLCLYPDDESRQRGIEEPYFDDYRHVGDRDFWELFSSGIAPVVVSRDNCGDEAYRPSDFKWFREAVEEFEVNKERFTWLLDYLESHPNSWLSASM